uniref:Uncharacterized protein n=1 Tax=Anguilla anguilla TaxID=7936 RepID=A0A0E9ULY8_ANGAN
MKRKQSEKWVVSLHQLLHFCISMIGLQKHLRSFKYQTAFQGR